MEEQLCGPMLTHSSRMIIKLKRQIISPAPKLKMACKVYSIYSIIYNYCFDLILLSIMLYFYLSEFLRVHIETDFICYCESINNIMGIVVIGLV